LKGKMKRTVGSRRKSSCLLSLGDAVPFRKSLQTIGRRVVEEYQEKTFTETKCGKMSRERETIKRELLPLSLNVLKRQFL